MCANCGMQAVAYLVMTAIGQRMFCSEECYAVYVGLPIMPEGHYGLEKIKYGDY
jgi:hypothetical protein|tara:strand:- start:2736 stop:2897 length:162 start_codon:yes stop_codon:yes gene_type:complete